MAKAFTSTLGRRSPFSSYEYVRLYLSVSAIFQHYGTAGGTCSACLSTSELGLGFAVTGFCSDRKLLLSTHADSKVWIYRLLFACLCTVTDFSAEDKASGVKFCRAVHRRLRQGISHSGELCFPRSPKSDESASARATPTRK